MSDDELTEAITKRAEQGCEDAELMRWAVEVITRLRLRLETQREELRLSKSILEALAPEVLKPAPMCQEQFDSMVVANLAALPRHGS
jgi:hypothetical protein